MESKLNRIIELEVANSKHCDELLAKFGDMLIRSESRVDNINHMIGNLIKMESASQHIVDKQTDVALALSKTLEEKERRIQYIEKKYEELTHRFDRLLEQYTQLARMKGVDTNITLKQNN